MSSISFISLISLISLINPNITAAEDSLSIQPAGSISINYYSEKSLADFSNSADNTSSTYSTSPDSLFIPISEFYYSDNQRYTISGKQPLQSTELKPIQSLIFAGSLTAVFIAQHIGQLKTIWKDMGDFKFTEDINQDLWVDKSGHLYGAYLTSYLLSESLIECGFSYNSATTWGALLGLSYSTYVEILDGFGENWGFSPSDFYADLLGSAFFLGQHYVPFLQNFTPKFMYFPAEWHGDKARQPHYMFIDDYSSQSFWLSVNVHNLLPESAQDYWPSWLQLSFGYTARNIVDVFHYPELKDKYKDIADVKNDYVWGSPRYVIALDYDLVKLLPDGPGFWNWMRQSLNHFKLPSPAIEFSHSKTRYYLVYPFQF